MINVTISKPEYTIDHKNIKRLLVCIVLLSAANNYKGVLQSEQSFAMKHMLSICECITWYCV